MPQLDQVTAKSVQLTAFFDVEEAEDAQSPTCLMDGITSVRRVRAPHPVRIANRGGITRSPIETRMSRLGAKVLPRSIGESAAVAAGPSDHALRIRGPGERTSWPLQVARSLRSNVAVLTGIVLLSGCGAASPGETDAPEPISIAIGEPVSALLPGNTVEENGTQVLESLWTGLVEYDTDGAVRYTGVAEPSSPTTPSPGPSGCATAGPSTGTPVTAESFVDAWNYAAYSPNAQAGSTSSPTSRATATCRPPWTTPASRPPLPAATS